MSDTKSTTTLPTTLQGELLDLLHLETFETRNSDGLDFSDQAVWSLLAACERAYQRGVLDGHRIASETATRALQGKQPKEATTPNHPTL